MDIFSLRSFQRGMFRIRSLKHILEVDVDDAPLKAMDVLDGIDRDIDNV